MAAELHLAENALALHLLLERLESLIDVIIADENLHAPSSFNKPDWNLGRRGATEGRIPHLKGVAVPDRIGNVHHAQGAVGRYLTAVSTYS
jgi:hypothetical protein